MIRKPLGCIFKIVGALLVLLVLAGTVGVFLANHYAIPMASEVLKQRTGFTMTASKQDISVLSGAVDLQDFLVLNPDRFTTKEFVDLKEFKMKVEPASLLGKQIVIDELVVNLDSFAVVQSKDGEYNFEALQKGLIGGAGATTASGKAGSAIPPFIIKKLTLRIGSAKYFNYKIGDGKPKLYNLNYERTFTDVTQADLAKVEVAIGTDLSAKGFTVFLDILKDKLLDPGEYINAVKGLGGAVIKGVGDVSKGVSNTVKGLFQ